MIGLMYAIGWGSLKLLTLILVILFLSRPWHIGERIACSAMTLLIGLGIPYWDYIPAKMYFDELCMNAGAKIFHEKKYEDPYSGVRPERNAVHYDWNVTTYERRYYDRVSGRLIAEYKAYRQDDGYRGFVKPWMIAECPSTLTPPKAINPDSSERGTYGDMPDEVYKAIKG